jgi:mRNA-degrading endonuclease RelE of RelBE toxin-antitoxin system
LTERLEKLDLEKWDVKPLKGYKGVFRVKKGKIRVIFLRDNIQKKGIVMDIDYRKDIYKKL